MHKSFFISMLLFLTLLTALPVFAETPEPGGWGGGHGRRWAGEPGMPPPPPFGDYCPRRHADHYGGWQPLQTASEAKERLSLFFSVPPVQISLRKEVKMGYIADILKPDGSLFDRVFIDKRTGRIRSIR